MRTVPGSGAILVNLEAISQMPKQSAGLLMYRRTPDQGVVEVLLGHPGGPLWAGKDERAWSIFKGLFEPDEEPLAAARREFEEETGLRPEGEFWPLHPIKQPGGKTVFAWAFEGDCDPALLTSNEFTMEWPPRSGRIGSFPEMDRAAWFSLDVARERIFAGQVALLDELETLLRGGTLSPTSS